MWQWWSRWWDSFLTSVRRVNPMADEPPLDATWGWSVPEFQSLGTYDKIYRCQPHVQTVVNFIAINLGQIGIKVYRRRSNDDRVEVHDHPLAVLLRQPNPTTTRYRFITELVTEIRRRFPDDGIVTEEGFATDPLFPPDAAAYRGAPMPFLAGNCVAHVEAVAACGGAIASVLEGLQ